MVVVPDGQVLASAPQGNAASVDVTLEWDRIRQARDPFSHLREEDPARLRAEFDRLLREG
jgi:hypothetical protein